MIDDPLFPQPGVIPVGADTARFRVWAPKAKAVELVLRPDGEEERLPMSEIGRGVFECLTRLPGVGDRYGYALDGGAILADPLSKWQPDGIHAPSAVIFPEHWAWNEEGWKGIEQRDLVFYELHVGTFTPEGTFDAIIPRIDALRELGISAIELMPVAQFPGRRSWGYDGVFPFAPQDSYGGPLGLKRLVEACHQKGMAVFLDVVYNHFGPEGNVLPVYGDYLTEKTKTDWGEAVNFDDRGCDAVRAFVLENVRMWIRDYRFDGLRLDAADQIYDRSPRHILSEIAEVAHDEGAKLGKPVHLFAETDQNDAPQYLHGYGLDGHWNDDFHHAAHVVLTGETGGYYVDFADGPKALAKVYSCVFLNDGTYSPFRDRRHGTKATEFSGDRFVAFTQNHDQVGNRMKSDRYAATLSPAAVRQAAGILLLAPRLPLIFMGQEYGETNPFPFFCDFSRPELIDAVREGRAAEFAAFGWPEPPPDPFAESTRDSAILSWGWETPQREGLRQLYRELLRLRRRWPALGDFSHAKTELLRDQAILHVRRGGETGLSILFNLSDEAQPLPSECDPRRIAFRSEAPEFGGRTSAEPAELRPREFVILEGA
jgi:maltooligosyltrehalose trehalohydrolase